MPVPDDGFMKKAETFYVRMTVHRNRLKWIKPTVALDSNFIGMTNLHVSGSLSAHHQEFWTIHRLWYIICSCGDRLLPGVPQLHIMYQSRCTAQSSWRWAERLPETCRVVIPIKVEFSATVGFIHSKAEICSTFWTKKILSEFFRSDCVSFCSFLLIKTLCLTVSLCV